MSNNKINEQYKNNLFSIREKLNMKQDEFAEDLGISPRAYGDYERWNRLLPPAVAKKIVDKYHFTFEFIYNLSDIEHYDTFMVDIRDIISYENNAISVKISDSYWKYLFDRVRLQNSDFKRNIEGNITELNVKYIPYDNSVFWKSVIEIDKGEFGSFYKSGDSVYPCHFEDNNGNEISISDEKSKEAKDIIEFFSSNRRFIKL